MENTVKYKLIAENAEEQQKIDTEIMPIMPLIDTTTPLIQSRSIMTAVRLGIFEAIGEGNSRLEDISQKLSLNQHALKLLLQMLLHTSYLEQQQEEYFLTDSAKETLLSSGSRSMVNTINYSFIRWNMLNNLEKVLQTGEGVDIHSNYLNNSDDWAAYQGFMAELAETSAKKIAPLIPVKRGAKKLLDIGGSHGFYGAMICRENSPMQSTVLDLPGAVAYSSEKAKERGLDDIVTYSAGDAVKDSWEEESYDVIFIGNIMHHFSFEQNQILLQKSFRALNEGGTLVVLDLEPSKKRSTSSLLGDAASLMFCLNSGTECYCAQDYQQWIEKIGFAEIQQHPTHWSGQLLVTAIKS